MPNSNKAASLNQMPRREEMLAGNAPAKWRMSNNFQVAIVQFFRHLMRLLSGLIFESSPDNEPISIGNTRFCRKREILGAGIRAKIAGFLGNQGSFWADGLFGQSPEGLSPLNSATICNLWQWPFLSRNSGHRVCKKTGPALRALHQTQVGMYGILRAP